MSQTPKPLSDIRIIAVEQYGAGPFGSMHLADLGAEVIKIEDPRVGGDVGRYVPPYGEGEDSLFFETFNRNKRSLSLDLTTSAGRASVRPSSSTWAKRSVTSKATRWWSRPPTSRIGSASAGPTAKG